MMLVRVVGGCDHLVDDCGDAKLLVHKNNCFETTFVAHRSCLDPNNSDNPELKCILQMIKDPIQVDKTGCTCMAGKLTGVSEPHEL